MFQRGKVGEAGCVCVFAGAQRELQKGKEVDRVPLCWG